MIDSTIDSDGILPDPVLHLFGPSRLKFLLADGTRGIAQHGIVGGSNPLLRRAFFGVVTISTSSSFGSGLGIFCALVIISLTRLNPILSFSVSLICPQIHTKSWKITYPFVDIPATSLGSLGSLYHALVGLKVPIQMPGFLLSALCSGQKTATTGSTPI